VIKRSRTLILQSFSFSYSSIVLKKSTLKAESIRERTKGTMAEDEPSLHDLPPLDRMENHVATVI
jgi:hypothetical protein